MISLAYAQTAAGGADPTAGLMQYIPLLVMVAAMWLLFIRPQMKKAKEHKALIEALAKGDEVVTSGGLVGKIAKVGENYVSLEIAEGTEVVVQKPAIGLVLPKGTLKSL
ncbi:MAG: protein translocase subunit yajC [Proteobacteria bacterium]|nr:protein translocase subunit yajC [Pseudomonadota bacterium]